MLLLELMCSAVMFVAGINVFYCDDCAKIDAPDCVLRSEILFRCCNWTSCSELIFAADLCVAQWNSVSLPQLNLLQLNLLQRSDIRCRVVRCAAKLWRQQRCSSCYQTGSLRRTSSRCQIGKPAANQFSLPIPTISLLGRNDLNANNNFMIWWCKIGNTWMWTYELLK